MTCFMFTFVLPHSTWGVILGETARASPRNMPFVPTPLWRVAEGLSHGCWPSPIEKKYVPMHCNVFWVSPRMKDACMTFFLQRCTSKSNFLWTDGSWCMSAGECWSESIPPQDCEAKTCFPWGSLYVCPSRNIYFSLLSCSLDKEGGNKKLSLHRAKNHSTQDSRVVPHRGTSWAALRLTAQIGRDAVLSESYGRGYYLVLWPSWYRASFFPSLFFLRQHRHSRNTSLQRPALKYSVKEKKIKKRRKSNYCWTNL